MEKTRMKSYMLLITFTAALLVVVLNVSSALGLLGRLWQELSPIVIACIIAFVANVPMTAIGNRLRKLSLGKKKPMPESAIGIVSLLITVLILVLLGTLVSTLAIPQLVQSVKSIVDTIREKIPELLAYLESLNFDTTTAEQYLEKLDFNTILSHFTDNAGNVLSMIVGAASSTIGSIVTFLMALIISIYIILNKQTLSHQAKSIAYANLRKDRADKLCYVAALTTRTYSKFLSGQCIEAVILGALLAIALSLFGIPYAGVIAVTTSLMSFVPYVGAFLSCLIGVLLVLMVDPFKALMCFVVFECVQFVEGHFIYPKVVGNSVGLPSMWTLIAVLLGGKLFGLLGMLFFIPLVAVLYTLVTEDTRKKLKQKHIEIA
ncbi:MAG: AI-2E family transporter [Oscillospiraceae bacterium]|nr:AI-2E family transporter [Oscillospiraceae bacterium]